MLADYDRDASTYDAQEYPAPLQVAFVRRLVETCPPDGTVLDAPCGTGRWFATVVDAGRHVVGVDQSAGMLDQARARGLATRLEQVGLQELAFEALFDAVMTVDAMEHVPPEDWPLVIGNLRRAARAGSHVYLTIEEIDQPSIDEAFATMSERGLPVVRGEVIEGDVGGYHFYPGRERAIEWLVAEGLDVLAEEFDQQDGWAYRHLLLRAPGA